MAAVQFSTGGLFLALAATRRADAAVGWAGALILAAAVLQGKLALKANQRRRAAKANPFRRTSFWRTMFVGVVCCYLLGLALGPQPSTPHLFAAAVCLWYSFTLLPIGADPRVLEVWRKLSQRKIYRKFLASVAVAAGLLLAAEVTLRGCDWILNRGWLDLANSPAGGNVAAAGLAAAAPLPVPNADGRFHVTIVGDEVTLGGIHNDGALSQLEVLVPGVRVTNFSVPNAGPRQYAADLTRRVLDCRPDLVLTFVSPGEDILSESSGSDLFNWRSLAVVKHWAIAHSAPSTPDADRTFLQSVGNELSVCRTPIDATTQRRWRKTLGHLEDLVRTCQRRKVDVALVVVPGEFQLNRVLLETLCRRMGYESKDLDLELPQRRLADFAGSHQIPCVDLLPHLRLCESSPYERDTRQWNAAGTAVALQTIGGWLQSRYGTMLPAAVRIADRR
jgi:hypothetical protein